MLYANVRVARAATGLWSAFGSWVGGSFHVLGCLSDTEARAFARGRCLAIGRAPRYIGGSR
jgi:hypothetical protein